MSFRLASSDTIDFKRHTEADVAVGLTAVYLDAIALLSVSFPSPCPNFYLVTLASLGLVTLNL